jgi:hypothetical protein
MLRNPAYRLRWEQKQAWYREQDILPYDEGGGSKGTLIVSVDEPDGGIDCPKITALVKIVKGLKT